MTTAFTKTATLTVATTLMALAGFALPASAADKAQVAYDSLTPMSSSQSSLLRDAPAANNDMPAGEPINEDVPASRSQIELLDFAHAHVTRANVASNAR
ncbi:hypothetical protein [Salinisphaera aquimarina]|uniref:Uncharacterized protein n=1 Tax=Salinisphaera aquimarina TaxID=2094031 RepID=A0ABV7ERZ1_9GAMM